MHDFAAQGAELLAALIRNRCVNDGTPGSGSEGRSAATLEAFLDGCGADIEVRASLPGRENLIARLPGRDPDAPALCLLAHTDVVPVVESRWSVDPFGAEVHDGHIWGRGAVDMLNQTAAQAVALRTLADSGRRLGGDVVFVAAADEENGGAHGAGWLCREEPALVACDYVVTEGGGFRLSAGEAADDAPLAVMVGEKGPMWQRLRFSGVAGHGSMPYRTDNALVKAAEAAQRLSHFVAPADLHPIWQQMLEAAALPDDAKALLADAATVAAGISAVAESHPCAARVLQACSHTTLSPNHLRAGIKTNVVPSEASLEVDVRVLPGVTESDVAGALAEALGTLFDAAAVETILASPATTSPQETPLWDVLCDATAAVCGPARLAPWLAPFSTDARFLRAAGAVAYGFTLHDSDVDLDTFGSMFHGDDEHVSIKSLGMSAHVYVEIARRLLT